MKLYYSPLSSYCAKTLIAFDEKKVPFTTELVQFGDPAASTEYKKVYPMGKVPLLVLDDGWKIPESTIIIEYLDSHYDSGTRLIPADKDRARQTRFFDRMCDLYLNDAVATLLLHDWKFRPASPEQLERARFQAGVMYGFLEEHFASRTWLMGDEFTMADCAAAPALFYAQMILPPKDKPNIQAYWKRLEARPSCKKVFTEVTAALKKMQEAA